MAGMDDVEDPGFRKTMIQIAAIAVAAVEAHDRKQPTGLQPRIVK